jgi:ABC-2 type transport system ATP-binding protein
VPEVLAAVTHLSRSFGAKKALNDVSLAVPRGSVFGLVGENGAGKSTLIKHLLGLWRAETGSVRLFGLDPVTDPVAVLARIGYLSEEPDLPGWMRVGELLRYTQAFYPRFDTTYAEHLRHQFAIDPDARIKTLSKGQRARLGLIVAEAHRPELLILDEPSSGLDPIVRRDILEAIIRTVTDEGRTVIFSSHLLDEVERVSDHLAMLHRGTLRLCAPLDDIKARHRRISLHFEQPQSAVPNVSGAIRVDGEGRAWTVICDAERLHAGAMAQHLGATVVDDSAASLDEIFVAHATN